MKISCIIPAYNEAATIVQTLKTAAEAQAQGAIDEILLINDASADETLNLASSVENIRIISNSQNLGKSKTVARGIREATGDFILFLDADLLGLNPENISDLTRPIREDQADVVISMRGNTPGWMKAIGVDCMSGERVLPRQFLEDHLSELAQLRGFALEVFLNRHIIAKKLRIRTVRMNNVRNKVKNKKRGFWNGVRGNALMWLDIFKTISPVEFVTQNIKLHRLLV